jgi:hypothetical protein
MKPQNKTNSVAIGAEWTISEYDDCVVAMCDPLGLTAYADTMEELHNIMEETVDDLFENLTQEGILNEFLHKRGLADQHIYWNRQYPH